MTVTVELSQIKHAFEAPDKKIVHHLKHIIPLTKLVIPNVTMFFAAFRRPHLFLKSWHLALPITVPP